jgi:hypothetical protein
MQNWWWNQMPDKVTITPADGSIVFKNAAGDAIGSIDTTDDGSGGNTDEITINKAKLTNSTMNGGSF